MGSRQHQENRPSPMESTSGIKKYPHGKTILTIAGGKELSPHGLLPGDLIFKFTGEQLLHVSIVTNVDAETGAADHVHLLNDAGLIGLHETTLMPASNLVVRCRNEPLRKAATEFARRWNALAVPYSNFRRRAAMVHEEKFGGDLVSVHRKLFDEVGKFRAIKYTARRGGDLIYPSEKDPRIEGNRGMLCSMFVVVCYQVAGLQTLVARRRATPTCRTSAPSRKICLDVPRKGKATERRTKTTFNSTTTSAGSPSSIRIRCMSTRARSS